MNIHIEVIDHDQQRYDTCGDWWFDKGGDLQIKVSDTGNWQLNFLVARHELDEAILCYRNGVGQDSVDKYDLAHPEAGSDDFSANPDAPYYQYHNDALASEWQMARLLGVDWIKYGQALEKVGWRKKDGDEAVTGR